MHPIDESSPLFGMSRQDVLGSDLGIVVVMNGTDESFAQPVYARHTYAAADIVWGRHFADIIGRTEDGKPSIDYAKFHSVEDGTG
jgi:inward rectifier potassium channel